MKKLLSAAAVLALSLSATTAQAAIVEYSFNVAMIQYDGDSPSDDTNRFFGDTPVPGEHAPGTIDGSMNITVGLDDSGGTHTLLFEMLRGTDVVYSSGTLALTGGSFTDGAWSFGLGDFATAPCITLDPNNGCFPITQFDFGITSAGNSLPTPTSSGDFSDATGASTSKDGYEQSLAFSGQHDKDLVIEGYQCGLNADFTESCNNKLTMRFGELGTPVAAIPVPAALPLLLSGLAGLGLLSARRRKNAA